MTRRRHTALRRLVLLVCMSSLLHALAAPATRTAVPRVNPLDGLSGVEKRSARQALQLETMSQQTIARLEKADHALQTDNQPQKALEHCIEAEQLYRQRRDFVEPFVHIEILTRLGRALSVLKRDCEAVPFMAQAVQLRPNEAVTLFSYGITLSNCGKDRESIAQYDRALLLGLPPTQRPPAMYMLARSLHGIGRWPRAIRLFRKVKQLDPNFPDVDLLLGAAIERSGQREEALKHFQATMERAPPGDARGAQRAGAVLIKLGRLSEAKPLLQSWIQTLPNLQPFYNRKPVHLEKELLGHTAPYTLQPLFTDGEEHPYQKKEYTVTPIWPVDAATAAKQAAGDYAGPTLFTVDDFLSSEEALTLRRLFDQLHSDRTEDPLTCFARTDKLDAMITSGALGATQTLTDGEAESQECVNATATVLQQISFSTSTFVFHDDHPLLNEIHMRLERVFGLQHKLGASSQLLRYVQNESYDKHTDCAPDTRRNDRAITVLIYLSDILEGGETSFPRLNVSVSPVVGRLAVFTSLEQDGFCDILSEHASLPVISGEKYVLQKWYHSVAHPGPGNVDDLFKHARRRQSVINCDFTNSCREYIRFSPAAARQDTRMYASRHPQAAAASKSRANAEKDEL